MTKYAVIQLVGTTETTTFQIPKAVSAERLLLDAKQTGFLSFDANGVWRVVRNEAIASLGTYEVSD